VDQKEHICWNRNERAAVMAAITAIVANEPTTLPRTAVHRAEEVLPPERRRLKRDVHFYGPKTLAEIREAIQAGLMVPRDQVPPMPRFLGEASKPAPPAEPLPELVSPPEEEPPFDIASLPTWALVGELATRLAQDFATRLDRIEAALTQAASARIAPQYRPPPIPTPVQDPKRPKKKRVCIIGLLKDQFEHVREKTGHLPFELVFVDKEARSVAVPPSEFAIIQRHSSHAYYHKAKALLGDRAVFVDGGITGVVQKLFDLNSLAKAA